jgi:prepilin-type N-terminal cleavage/methylation domain-containing protein
VRNKRHAFTLIELLVVLAIILVLAGMLFPVFRGARESAHRTTCLMNMRQTQQAFSIYFSDYDDRFVPVNHRPFGDQNSRNDRTWVQLTLPYIKSFAVFRCPSDYGTRTSADATFDQDLVPGDTYAQYYTASLHVNLGYNYVYMSPVLHGFQGWRIDTKMVSSVSDPSQTMMLVDSLWKRTEDGIPYGGGSWLVTPPCRYVQENGRSRDTFLTMGDADQIFTVTNGWTPDPKSTYIYGGAWPWHAGRMNVIRVDGSARTVAPGQLTEGCDVRANWSGYIRSRETYLWDVD